MNSKEERKMRERVFYLSTIPIIAGFLVMVACAGERSFWLGVAIASIGVVLEAVTEPEPHTVL